MDTLTLKTNMVSEALYSSIKKKIRTQSDTMCIDLPTLIDGCIDSEYYNGNTGSVFKNQNEDLYLAGYNVY